MFGFGLVFIGRLGPGRADFWICGSSGETWDKCGGGGLLVAFLFLGFGILRCGLFLLFWAMSVVCLCLGIGLVFFGRMGPGWAGLIWGCAPAFWGDFCCLSVCSEFGLVFSAEWRPVGRIFRYAALLAYFLLLTLLLLLL